MKTGRQTERKRKNNLENVIYIMYNILYINTIESTLMALSNIIDTSRMKAPAFCMVLTGVGDFAYKRTDGVYVVPIGCLKN
jgi:hypothetical protein